MEEEKRREQEPKRRGEEGSTIKLVDPENHGKSVRRCTSRDSRLVALTSLGNDGARKAGLVMPADPFKQDGLLVARTA